METKLIVLRGPSGSGKSSIAKELRLAQSEKMALIGQDHFRRIVLKEKDVPNGLNSELIERTAVFALENSYHVLLEGIFDAERYARMFTGILSSHPTNNHFFYFDIPFEATLRRHQSKPNKDEFGETEMRSWYKDKDLLHCAEEILIPESYTQRQTVEFLLSACKLKRVAD